METSNVIKAICVFFALLTVEGAPSPRRSRAVDLPDADPTREMKLTSTFKDDPEPTAVTPSSRKNKALNFLGYFPSFLSSGLDYGEDDDDVTFSVNDDSVDDDDLSRTIPSRRRQQNKKKNNNNNNNNYPNDNLNSLQYDNSPMFFIRLPPTPYMFVPGLGYVSNPPNLGPPMGPPPVADPFINVPIDFVSNAKPTGIYQWNGAPAYQPQVPQDPYGYQQPLPVMPSMRPPSYNSINSGFPMKPQRKPVPSNTKVTNLKGPYVFNGKPSDNVFVLRDTYNSLYSDALQNFYP